MGLDPRGHMKGNVGRVWDDKAQYRYLFGIATDDAGAVYVADRYGVRFARSEHPDTLEHFTSPMMTKGFNDGPAEGSAFSVISYIVASPDGAKVFVADSGNKALRVIVTGMSGVAGVHREVFTIVLRDAQGKNVDVSPGYLALGRPNAQGETNELYFTTYLMNWYEPSYGATNDHVVYKVVLVNGLMPNSRGDIIGRVSIVGGVKDTPGFMHTDTGTAVGGTTGASLFHTPRGMIMDDEGILYVCDSGNHVIRAIYPDGVTYTFAGDYSAQSGYANGPKEMALFSEPSDIVYNRRSRSFYVADTGNNAIREISKDNGKVRLIAGASYAAYVDGVGGCARLTRPRSLALGAKGTLYFTDVYHSTVRKVNFVEGRITEYCKESNRLYGEVKTIAGKPYQEGHMDGHDNTLDEPSDMAVDKFGNIFFTDDDAQCIRKLNRKGHVSSLAGKCDEYGFVDGHGTNARFEDIYSIAVTDRGIIYVADRDNEAIRKVTKDGYVSTFAGHAGGMQGDRDGLGTVAMFDKPVAVTLDDRDFLYVADRNNNKVRRITRKGDVTTLIHEPYFHEELREVVYNKFTDRLFILFDETIMSTNMRGKNEEFIIGRKGDSYDHGTVIDAGMGWAAGFYNPYAMDIDAEGFIFVTDSDHNVIRMISPGPMHTVTTIAGNFDLTPGHRDGVGSRAMFAWPWGITLDHFGNLIVADADSSTLRKIKVVRPPVA
eukprot:CAMPEP_0182416820 /NCGR_PEP_ID=MMETSP1167-20130531/1184_1 /TAXON_ID=2988 /ORGANISM="Mallomonas Sp, Strain CCMP3275" /LENGTH=714 /DNA_ID=CAMNT_0024589919 /DNA_START=149 /DNA_END=2293 /DNA_ORIENTATION=-